MLAPLSPVISVTSLSRPAVTAAGAGSAPSAPGVADFSGVLAAERAGGEKLPQPQATEPAENSGGKSLPGVGDNPASTDAAAEAGADIEGSVGADARASAQMRREQGFAPASLQAQARAAEGSAVINGVPARAEPVAESELSIQQANADAALSSALESAGQIAKQEMDQAAEPLLSPSGARAPLAVQDESGPWVGAVPQVAVATESANISTVDGDGDGDGAARAPAVDNSAVDIAGAVSANAAAASAPPVDIQTLMSAIQREAGQALPPAVIRALQAQQAQQVQHAEQRLEAAPAAATPGLNTEPVLAGSPPRLPDAELAPVSVTPNPGLAPQNADAGAEQTRVRLSAADAMVRLAGAAEAGADQGDDSTLQVGVLRTGAEGTRAAQPLNPLPAQLQSMPPGLSPGLSQGNAAWGQAISERVLLMTAGSLQVAEIRLDPPELGTLHVRLQLNQDQASLSFSSPHAQVRDALEQQMPRLREMLAEQGLNLESSSVADDSERRERSAPDAGQGTGLMAEQDEDTAITVVPVAASSRSLVDDYA